MNHWEQNSRALTLAYAQRSSEPAAIIRFNLVARDIAEWADAAPKKIIDIGAGFGQQSIALARAGHSVVLVEPSTFNIEIAREMASCETRAVQSRLSFFNCSLASLPDFPDRKFDVVCCHSVMMYIAPIGPFLKLIVRLVRDKGLVSVVGLNTTALAFRSGLTGDWAVALDLMRGTRLAPSVTADRAAHSLEDISDGFHQLGVETLRVKGLCVFSDHLKSLDESCLDTVMEIEWLAGQQDPYKQVARLFHYMGQNCN